LALVQSAAPDRRERQKALALFESPGQPGEAVKDPEDLRVLARVLEAQQTAEHRKRAIEILESLVSQGRAEPEDRIRLAQLEESAGEWPKAREQFRALIRQNENPRDAQTIRRRPRDLLLFAEALIRNRRPGDDLPEAQELLAKLKRIQPEAFNTVVL